MSLIFRDNVVSAVAPMLYISTLSIIISRFLLTISFSPISYYASFASLPLLSDDPELHLLQSFYRQSCVSEQNSCLCFVFYIYPMMKPSNLASKCTYLLNICVYFQLYLGKHCKLDPSIICCCKPTCSTIHNSHRPLPHSVQ